MSFLIELAFSLSLRLSASSLLLERNPKYRLGSGYYDVQEIKQHSFFKNIDWNLLYQKKITPVYKPNVGKNQLDTSNFDKTFTSEPIVKTYDDHDNNNNNNIANNNNNNKFEEFSFVANIDDNNDDDQD